MNGWFFFDICAIYPVYSSSRSSFDLTVYNAAGNLWLRSISKFSCCCRDVLTIIGLSFWSSFCRLVEWCLAVGLPVPNTLADAKAETKSHGISYLCNHTSCNHGGSGGWARSCCPYYRRNSSAWRGIIINFRSMQNITPSFVWSIPLLMQICCSKWCINGRNAYSWYYRAQHVCIVFPLKVGLEWNDHIFCGWVREVFFCPCSLKFIHVLQC